MNRAYIVAVILAAAVAVGGAAYVATRPTEEEKLLAACDTILMKRLMAPSTYKRASATPLSSTKADFNQFMGWDAPGVKEHEAEVRRSDPAAVDLQDARKKLFSGVEWTRYSTWIEYDAANAYGTPMRSTAECVLIARASDPLSVSAFSDVRVDGFDALGWTVHQLWLSRQ